MNEQLTFKELCLISHCLNRKSGVDTQRISRSKIDEMCQNLQNLTAVMHKIEKMSLEACENEAKARKKEQSR